MKDFLKKYWISIIVNTAILVVCMIKPPADIQPPMTDFDKLVHFVLFMGISGVVFFDNTFYLRRKISLIRLFCGSLLFPCAFGGLIEILQATFTNTRSGDVMDFLFDSIGAAAGTVICFLINIKLKQINKNKYETISI
jgi:VanZ family protein